MSYLRLLVKQNVKTSSFLQFLCMHRVPVDGRKEEIQVHASVFARADKRSRLGRHKNRGRSERSEKVESNGQRPNSTHKTLGDHNAKTNKCQENAN